MLCEALLVAIFGVTACGAVEKQVRDRAYAEVAKHKQKAEDRIKVKSYEGVGGTVNTLLFLQRWTPTTLPPI